MVASTLMTMAWSRRVVAVWLVLAALVAVIVVIEGTSMFTPPPPARTGRFPVFSFDENTLGAVEGVWEGRTANLVRDVDGRWMRHDGSHRHSGPGAGNGVLHRADPQVAGFIEEQLRVSSRMLADRRIEPERELDAYGLATPQLMLAFYGRTGKGADYARPLDVLYVGDLLTTGYSYYTLLDGDRDITLIPRYQIALILALLFGEDAAPSPLPGKSPDGADR